MIRIASQERDSCTAKNYSQHCCSCCTRSSEYVQHATVISTRVYLEYSQHSCAPYRRPEIEGIYIRCILSSNAMVGDY